MPLFKNDTAQHLSFDVGDEHYEVPPGKACEIPKSYVYVIASRGLPLTRGADEAEVVDSTESRPLPLRLPHGVENVPADGGDDDDSDDEGADGAAEVAQTVAALERQGVTVPGRKGKR